MLSFFFVLNGFDLLEKKILEYFNFYLDHVHVNVDVNDHILDLGMKKKKISDEIYLNKKKILF